ncbi:SLAIN motif-containing protein 2 [Frankliniella fusca]|uniref:SLAIN motif-containing protein 2 n=1 Tax=Frankliniella fusca TaxID=407009 RepID=A0AAE1HQ58_9NEOP|nr:SLAIN motif-containing protein 2 [Frankliniella fusca]
MKPSTTGRQVHRFEQPVLSAGEDAKIHWQRIVRSYRQNLARRKGRSGMGADEVPAAYLHAPILGFLEQHKRPRGLSSEDQASTPSPERTESVEGDEVLLEQALSQPFLVEGEGGAQQELRDEVGSPCSGYGDLPASPPTPPPAPPQPEPAPRPSPRPVDAARAAYRQEALKRGRNLHRVVQLQQHQEDELADDLEAQASGAADAGPDGEQPGAGPGSVGLGGVGRAGAGRGGAGRGGALGSHARPRRGQANPELDELLADTCGELLREVQQPPQPPQGPNEGWALNLAAQLHQHPPEAYFQMQREIMELFYRRMFQIAREHAN